MKNPILVDTNVFVFASNKSSSKHKAALQFIKTSPNICLAHQNIVETLRVVTHPKYLRPQSIERASKQIQSFIDQASVKIISPKNDTLQIFLKLMQVYKPKGNAIFDSYLVATMLSNNIKQIATDNDKDFKKYKQIKVINPFKN